MADPKKQGWRTSEFWTFALTAIVSGVNQAGVLPFTIPNDIMLGIIATAATYIAGRLGVKAVNANADAKVQTAEITAAAKVDAAKASNGQ